MIRKSNLILSTLFFASALAYKVLVVNDMHADPNYNPTSCAPPPDDAASENGILAMIEDEPIAPIGRYGCDPPITLMTTFLDKIKSTDPDVNLIFMPGDFAAHGLSKDPDT